MGAEPGQGGDGFVALHPLFGLFDLAIRAVSSAVRVIGEHTVSGRRRSPTGCTHFSSAHLLVVGAAILRGAILRESKVVTVPIGLVGKRSLISGMSRIERPRNSLLSKPLIGESF